MVLGVVSHLAVATPVAAMPSGEQMAPYHHRVLFNADNESAQLLGFLIRDSDASDDVLLPVDPGLAVLYGLNGAGKSRTLQDIRGFWRGTASESFALIRVPEPMGNIDWSRETARGDWYPDWARRAGSVFKFEDDILDHWIRGCLEADDVTLPGERHRPDRLAELLNEWFQQRLILVQAVGTETQGQWVSAPAFLTGPGLAATNAEVALFESIERQDAWVDHGDEYLLTPFGKAPDGRTICSATLFGTPVLDESQWPFSAGRHDRLIDLGTRLLNQDEDVDERTRTHLVESVPQLVQWRDGEARPSAGLVEQVRRLEALTNAEFSGVLQDAPVLRLHVNPVGLDRPVEWYVQSDRAAEIVAEDDLSQQTSTAVDAGKRERDLSGLSTAQRRWALWSIEMALQAAELRGALSARLILIDEPEAALHRSAEARMADYLGRLSGDGATRIVAATHSPELLDLNASRVYEVARRRARTVTPLTQITREDMRSLGLQPSDLLRRQRGFILVEGEHDEIVLDTLFGDQLRALQVEVLPMRGTRQLSPAKIGFLFTYTPGHVFIMLDNVSTAQLDETWQVALGHRRAGRGEEAITTLADASCLRSDEGKKLREVLQHALSDGQSERITPHGLGRADIIEYLPVDALVPAGLEWSDLRERHQQARTEAPTKTARDFKAWLCARFGADFGPDAMRSAAAALDVPPPDLLRLLKVVEAHATARRVASDR